MQVSTFMLRNNESESLAIGYPDDATFWKFFFWNCFQNQLESHK